MKAAVYRGIGQISVEEVEKPTVKPDEYLVEVLCSGLCGTDIKTYKQGHRMFQPPCVLGHEFCGQIVEAGARMNQALVGRKVVCAPYIGCGRCKLCRSGFEELCHRKVGTDGAFTEYLTVCSDLAQGGMVLLEDDADIRQMTLTEPFACILNSMEKSQVKMGQNSLVIGAGPMGLLHVAGLKLFGADHILVTEYNESRGAIAAQMGAHVINPSGCQNLREEIYDALDGSSLDQIFVCVGMEQAVEEAMTLCSEGTTVNIFGGLKNGSSITIDPNIIHYSDVKLVGTFGFASHHFLESARLLSKGKVNLSGLITNVYSLEDAAQAFEMAAHPTPDVVKVLIQMK